VRITMTTPPSDNRHSRKRQLWQDVSLSMRITRFFRSRASSANNKSESSRANCDGSPIIGAQFETWRQHGEEPESSAITISSTAASRGPGSCESLLGFEFHCDSATPRHFGSFRLSSRQPRPDSSSCAPTRRFHCGSAAAGRLGSSRLSSRQRHAGSSSRVPTRRFHCGSAAAGHYDSSRLSSRQRHADSSSRVPTRRFHCGSAATGRLGSSRLSKPTLGSVAEYSRCHSLERFPPERRDSAKM